MFKNLGFLVEFTQLFIERLLGRESKVTVKEILTSFQKLKAKYFRQLQAAKDTDGIEGLIRDFSRDLNIVFSIDGDEMDAITIMKKDPKQFKSNSADTIEFRV